MRAAWAALLVMLLDSWSSGFSNLEKPFTFRTGSVKSHPTSPIWVHDPILTTERRLWRGVLEQAYADAELPLGVEADDELFIDQDRARRFLRADTVSGGALGEEALCTRRLEEVNEVEEVKEVKDRKGIAACCSSFLCLL